ncbi:shufflon system plasmid conjugative transfer pilus tip adhesin PilV [Erwinia rhapontici]|uniref:shufflon system plasmid conjugative transfer pilus tip adhesin PilV n=2 Tax=Erwinia rhapontici TaxID=55212 RepID=UPI001FD1D60A|nr:shufflon system plasmid conjugative transfer pilus tip adhesin PilV [Erwinia rhapontici]
MKQGIANIADVNGAMVIVMAIIITLLIPLSLWAAEEYRMNIAAGQARTVQKAVTRYVSDQQSVIAAASSSTEGYTLTVPMLISAGYLPTGFSSTNSYTGTYRTLIFQPAASKFHTMTFMSGGSSISMSQARKLAEHIGAEGGYIENGVAKGAMGSWEENLAAFGGYNPGNGSVVMSGFFMNGALVNDYLYRHKVAGHPELNRMGTDLDMGGNSINNAATVNATKSINSAGTIVADGNVTSKADISAEGNLNADKDLVLGGVAKLGQINTEGKICDTWGSISRDATGAILSCQSGVWSGSKSNGSYRGLGTFTGQYNGSNTTAHTITVYVSGGSSTVNKGIDDGSCVNTWALNASVGGAQLINAYDWNTGWSKKGFITLQVPAKTSYRIVSDPLPSQGCGPGYFSVSEYR